uniref:Uncharacterized protein n=1 Tax=Anguilla anguilla TaxID=7936 RepID=A0A0E9SGY7_ANGAN
MLCSLLRTNQEMILPCSLLPWYWLPASPRSSVMVLFVAVGVIPE